MKTKLVLVADKTPFGFGTVFAKAFGFGTVFAKAFEALGHSATIIDEWGLYREVAPLARHRIWHRLAWKWLARPFQRRLVSAIAAESPDIVLVFKGLMIAPATLDALRHAVPHAVLFNYNPDNPFNTWHRGSSNNWVRRALPKYDTYFMWGEFLREPLLRAGVRRFEYLPFGYEPSFHHPVTCTEAERAVFQSDVAFVGTWDEERERWLQHVGDFDLKIWGNSWEKAGARLKSKWTRREVILDDMSRVMGAAKINLNFVRKQNGSSHNMRTFEVPACGGFVLSTRTAEQQRLFVEDREIALFSSPEELRAKIEYFLSHDAERRAMAAAAHQRVIGEPNTYQDRAARILAVYRELAEARGNARGAPPT